MSIPEPFTCPRCGYTDTHSLHCPTLRLQPGWAQRAADEEVSTR